MNLFPTRTRIPFLRCFVVSIVLAGIGLQGNAYGQDAEDLILSRRTPRSFPIVSRFNETITNRYLISETNLSTNASETPTNQPHPANRHAGVSDQDEVWFVSSRESYFSDGVQGLTVSKLVSGNWQSSSLKDLVDAADADRDRANVVFVHGNRYALEEAQSRGLLFYQNVFNSDKQRPPIRLVLFGWRSERERLRPITDFTIKSQRAIIVGEKFGRFLQQFEKSNLTICSYSLGAQIVVAGIEHCQARRTEEQDRLSSVQKIAMMAPAFDPNYACSRLSSFGKLELANKTHIFVNDDDLVIRGAELLTRKRCRDSASVVSRLSRMGESGQSIGPVVHQLSQEISSSHALSNYVLSPTIQTSLCEMIMAGDHARLQRSAKADENVSSRRNR